MIEHFNPALAAEMEALVRDYYARTPAHTGIPPYEFNWDVYANLARNHALMVITAREAEWPDTLLLGFGLYILLDHPHHKDLLVAECDSLSVRPEARGRGIARGIVREAEDALRAIGVDKLIHRHRHCYGADPLFPKLGFEAAETVWQKDL